MNKTTYFNNPQTLEELKSQYKKLVMKHHPDRGGNHETMVEINLEYEKLFEVLKDTHKTKDGKTYTKQNNETPHDFINLINELMKMYGVHVEVIGLFIWVSGETKPHKDSLKAMGFRWHSTKKMWYKAPQDYRKYTKTKYNMNEIRSMYGVQFEADGKGLTQIECYQLAS